MGNLTKEQLEKRLDEVLAELEAERKKSSQLEIDLNGLQSQLQEKGAYIDDLLGVVKLRDEAIFDLETRLKSALSSPSLAPVDPAREALIREKIRAGLSRQQAEEVIKAQEAEDARRAEAEEDED